MAASSTTSAFRAVGYPWRLHAGDRALESLGTEVQRTGRRRAFVICGRSVATRTDLVERVRGELGARFVGVFDRMDKDCSFAVVGDAVVAAERADADLLVAIGGGSVIVGTRAVAIFMAEEGDPFDLMTQYPEGRPPVSPRLDAPKVPIINVVTTPTAAMNRGGTALRNDELDHRMEYYDPKTRPVALFWDSAALMSAPVELLRSTGVTTFTQALQLAAAPTGNPLSDGDLSRALTLAKTGLTAAVEEPESVGPRIDLCAAAFLMNRAADDHAGRPLARDAITGAAYAISTAVHVRYRNIGQGEATAAVLPHMIRHVPDDVGVCERMAESLGHVTDRSRAVHVAADALTEYYTSIGMPTRLGDLGLPIDEIELVARETVKNFNANRGQRSDDEFERMLGLVRAAW